jgi:hypothetical protein
VCRPRQNNGEPPAHEVEGNFVDVLVLMLQMKVFAEFDMLQDRDVKQVFQAGLIMTIQIGKFQHPFAIIAANVEIELEDDAVLRECAGLSVHKTSIAPKFYRMRTAKVTTKPPML